METACGLFSTVAALMAPCSVKAMGKVVTMCEQLQPFLFAESKDEIAWETIRIPLNGLVQGFRRHVIQCSEVGIDNNLVGANREIMDLGGLSCFTTRAYRCSERLGVSVPPSTNRFDQGTGLGWPCPAGGDGVTRANTYIPSTPIHPQ